MECNFHSAPESVVINTETVAVLDFTLVLEETTTVRTYPGQSTKACLIQDSHLLELQEITIHRFYHLEYIMKQVTVILVNT